MKKAELEEQIEIQRAVIIDMRNKIERLENRWQAEQEFWQRVCDEHNALAYMLQELFSLQVGARDFDGDTPLWDVTDLASGEILVHHERDIIEAYRQAILKKYQS